MSTKFEKLIEYVINDEEQKARDLFHEIVVEKSRTIYENLMAEEAAEEEELEESAEEMEESMHDMEETLGGDAADQLMNDVAADETAMEADEEMDMTADMGDGFADEEMAMDMTTDGSDDIGTDIASIDSKLDELLAKFEEVIGADGEVDGEEDDEMTIGSEEEEAEEEVEESLAENVQLQKVSVDHGDRLAAAQGGGDKLSQNKKSPVAANAGAGVTGAVAKPASSKFTAENPDGTRAPSAQKAPDIESGLQNAAGKNMAPLKPATKPHLAQATGVNTKSTLKPLKK